MNGVTDRTYLHGPRGPEYERVGANAPVWYPYDGLGSVLGTVDGAGNLVSTRKYDVYGAVRASTGPSGPKHKFVGGLGHPSEDDTGLIYMRARYMDPVTGRFVSEDPAASGQNWFRYAETNPITSSDLSGEVAYYFGDGRWLLALFQEMVARGCGTGEIANEFRLIARVARGKAQAAKREAYLAAGEAEMLRTLAMSSSDPMVRSYLEKAHSDAMMRAHNSLSEFIVYTALARSADLFAQMFERM